MPRTMKSPTEDMIGMLRRAGSFNPEESRAGYVQLAKSLELPLRKGVLAGDIITGFGIYEPRYFPPGTHIEWPIDLLAPGTERLHTAWTMPSIGSIPERHVGGDYIAIPTYEVTSSIDCNAKYARDGNWNIVDRMLAVLEGGFIRKFNMDGWRTILASVYSRGLAVNDTLVAAGFFGKRVLSLARIAMRRNGGGNSTSQGRGRLTDLFMSPEALEDMRTWDLSQIDELGRQQIRMANVGTGGDYGMTNLYNTNLHDLDELGEGQEFTNYYTGTLGGSLGSKSELAIGLDLAHDDSFVMPWRQMPEIFEDPTYHRARRISFYGWAEIGFSCLDTRRVMAVLI